MEVEKVKRINNRLYKQMEIYISIMRENSENLTFTTDVNNI